MTLRLSQRARARVVLCVPGVPGVPACRRAGVPACVPASPRMRSNILYRQAEQEARLQGLRAAHAQREHDLHRRLRGLSAAPPSPPARATTPSAEVRRGRRSGAGEEPSSPAAPAPPPTPPPAAKAPASWFSPGSGEWAAAEAGGAYNEEDGLQGPLRLSMFVVSDGLGPPQYPPVLCLCTASTMISRRNEDGP